VIDLIGFKIAISSTTIVGAREDGRRKSPWKNNLSIFDIKPSITKTPLR
jgi:hypothetical protein